MNAANVVTADNILVHELVGLQVKIIESSDPTLENIKGIIVFETKNMISIRTNGGVKQIPKLAAKKIELHMQSGACFISGSSLIGRPEDRTSRINS